MTSTPPSTTNTGDLALRVIAVGLQGRERSLRHPDVELIRARNAVEAIGELGIPIDDSSPRRTVVVLESKSLEAREIPDLADALRRINEHVRIVALDGHADHALDPRARGALDAVLDADARSEDLLGLFENRQPAEPTTTLQPTPPPEQTKAEPEQRPPALDTHHGIDTPASVALKAILSGRDIVMSYIDWLARIPSGDDITYVDINEGIPRPPETRENAVVDVALRGKRFGWIIGPRAIESTLRATAEEIALCIAVQRQQDQLRDSAFKDHLTGAWNRRYFDRYLARSMDDARARRLDLTILLFDIDDFKHYNDAYGHAAGDEILVETVRLLRAVTRPTDEVCRIGGDEFAAIFYEPDGPREPGSRPPRTIFSIAHRFRQQIRAHRFPKLGEQAKGRLTISGGLATFPWDGHDAESLIDHADRLLLQSKREGKNVIGLGPGAMRVCGPEGGRSRSEGDGP